MGNMRNENININIITNQGIDDFVLWLRLEERSEGTIINYRRNLNSLMKWLDGEELTKESAAKWKEHLTEEGYSPVTINIASVLLRFRVIRQ